MGASHVVYRRLRPQSLGWVRLFRGHGVAAGLAARRNVTGKEVTKMKVCRLGLLGLLLLAGWQPGLADDWLVLGSRSVKNRAERDVIEVTRQEGTFTKIKIQVKRRAVAFFDVKIHFGNGEVMDVALRSKINAGDSTRVIDLPGKRRVVKKVVFVYKTKANNGKKRAEIILLGR